MRLRWISTSSAAVCLERSVPLGKYWRSRPLVFSFEPRCRPRRPGHFEAALDLGQLGGGVLGEVGALGQVLAKQTVGVLFRAALPW